MNVMIVDDEVLTRTNVKYILEAEIPAYTGTTSYMLCGEAGSGAEAWKNCRSADRILCCRI